MRIPFPYITISRFYSILNIFACVRGIKWFTILIWISLLLENLTTLYVLTLNLFFYEISNFNFCSLYINTLFIQFTDLLYGKTHNTVLTLHTIECVYLLLLRLRFPDVVKESLPYMWIVFFQVPSPLFYFAKFSFSECYI